MTERISRSYDLSVAPAELVDRLRMRQVVDERCAADGLGTHVVGHFATEDDVRVVVGTDIPVDWLPGLIRSRLSTSPTVERAEAWTVQGGVARTPLTFTFAGMPVTGSGDAEAHPAPSGSRLEFRVDITVDVPFVGGLVEAAVAPRIVAALDAEAAFYGTLGRPDSAEI